MIKLNNIRRALYLSVAVATASGPTVLQAAPYASGVTNNNGTVQFILNESGGSVTVLFNNNTVTNVLGVLPSGLNTFALGAHTNYSIVVTKNGTGQFTQVSVDTTNNSFNGPRGVAVNTNPKTAHFGLVYSVNASAGTGTAPSRAVGKGIYINNADTSDAFGRFATVSTGGTVFGSSATYSPYKIYVGPDDMVYSGDATEPYNYTVSATSPGAAGSVTMYDPAITVSTPILNWANAYTSTYSPSTGPFGGTISSPVVTGSLAAGTLQLYCFQWGFDESGGVYDCLYNFPIGGTPYSWPSSPVPNIEADPAALDTIQTVNEVVQDLTLAPDGKFFVVVDRGAGPGQDCLFVYANDAQTLLYDSLTAVGGSPANAGNTGIDPFLGCLGVTVSPDDKYVACVYGSSGAVLLASLTNGLPDLSTLSTNATGLGGTTRSLAFDAADNIYVISGGVDRLREYSLGLTTTATTYNDLTGTNGTFTLVVPPTTVSVVAITNQASQSGPTAGVFQLTRAGQNLNQPLTVHFDFTGTATGGVYTVSPAGITSAGTNTIVFAANQTTTNITITPVVDSVPRPTTTVTLALLSGTNYSAVFPNQDTVAIQNTAPDAVYVSGIDCPTMYNVFSNSYASFIITRIGDTNAASFTVTSYSYAGTGVPGVDYTLPGAITFNPGDISYTNYIYPLVDGVPPTVDSTTNPYVGNKTVLISTGSGTGYTGATNAGLMTILDSANPPATVLWADPLTSASDTNSWVTNSANNDMPTYAIDNTIEFGYDLQNGDPGDNGAIPLPPSGATTALRVTCNKTGGSIGQNAAAAGVNLYPTNVSFSGNYAVRFSMNIIQGYDYNVTTEGPLFGINHTGQATNWWTGSGVIAYPPTAPSGWESDGVWYWICADTGTEEYLEKTGVGGSLPNTGWLQLNGAYVPQFEEVFNTNIFTGGTTSSGLPGNLSNGSVVGGIPSGLPPANNWADVEMKQYNGVVTLSVDKTPIFVYTNTTTFTNGTIMLGYNDPYSSVGTPDAAVYYSNLRVVSLAGPTITQIAINSMNSTAVINFTSPDGDATPASFNVVSSANVAGPYTAAAGATITSLGAGGFQAVVPENGSIQFYRIVGN